jgi:hypothetical protein
MSGIFRYNKSFVSSSKCEDIFRNPSSHKDIYNKTQDVVEKFLYFSRESHPFSYYAGELSVIHVQGNSKTKARFDSELIFREGFKLVQNFAALINLKVTEVEVHFPFQEYCQVLDIGDILMYPTSFMYPFSVSNKNKEDTALLRMEYLFKKESTLKPILEDRGNINVY